MDIIPLELQVQVKALIQENAELKQQVAALEFNQRFCDDTFNDATEILRRFDATTLEELDLAVFVQNQELFDEKEELAVRVEKEKKTNQDLTDKLEESQEWYSKAIYQRNEAEQALAIARAKITELECSVLGGEDYGSIDGNIVVDDCSTIPESVEPIDLEPHHIFFDPCPYPVLSDDQIKQED